MTLGLGINSQDSVPLYLDMEALLTYQQNRPPYLMMDCATEVIPGISAKGYKYLQHDLWFFGCHFPGDPNMPGMLQAEALVQMAALTVFTLPGNKGKVVYLTQMHKLTLRRKVLPGDTFMMEAELSHWRRGIGRCKASGLVEDQIACYAEFSFAMPDIIESYRPEKNNATKQ